MSQSLPKDLRILSGSDIRQILNHGRKYTGIHLILFCATIPSIQHLRAGFITPKRLGNACKRNRLRRWMREAFRRHRIEIQGSPQILMMGRISAIRSDYHAVCDDFLRLCRKARLMSESAS